jgi:hypothetical protein
MIIVMEECPDMSTYIRTQWVTHLRVSRLLNMSLVLDKKREGDSESDSRKSRNGSIISRMVPEWSKTLPVIYKKVSEEIRSKRSIYGKSGMDQKGADGSRRYARFQNVPGRPGMS